MSNLEVALFIAVISMGGMLAATTGVRFALAKLGCDHERSKHLSILLALAVLSVPPLFFGNFLLARVNFGLFVPSAALIFLASLLRGAFKERGANRRE